MLIGLSCALTDVVVAPASVVPLVLFRIGEPAAFVFSLDWRSLLREFASFPILPWLIGVLGFFVALAQYRSGQRWKRTEFTWQVIREMVDYRELQICRTMLDYPIRPIFIPLDILNLPEEMISRDPCLKKADAGYFYSHSWWKLRERLRVAYSPNESLSASDILVRSAFDALLHELEQVESSVKSGFLDSTLVDSYGTFWIQVMQEVEDQIGEEIFRRYAEAFGYTDFIMMYDRAKRRAARGETKPLWGYHGFPKPQEETPKRDVDSSPAV
jgi:hypothetical protein